LRCVSSTGCCTTIGVCLSELSRIARLKLVRLAEKLIAAGAAAYQYLYVLCILARPASKLPAMAFGAVRGCRHRNTRGQCSRCGKKRLTLPTITARENASAARVMRGRPSTNSNARSVDGKVLSQPAPPNNPHLKSVRCEASCDRYTFETRHACVQSVCAQTQALCPLRSDPNGRGPCRRHGSRMSAMPREGASLFPGLHAVRKSAAAHTITACAPNVRDQVCLYRLFGHE
jgi:hypothetical protein